MRQVILDTETTGLKTADGHRIIEIGCVELVNRRFTGNNYHQYVNPARDIEKGALAVHGITNEELKQKPKFAVIADEFINYISGSEVIIHNAAFDLEFINYELKLCENDRKLDTFCEVTDSLKIAREQYPGQHNSLDALCRRLGVDNSTRELHGALLDAEILADVYLLLTGGQFDMALNLDTENTKKSIRNIKRQNLKLKVIPASIDEMKAHDKFVKEFLT